MIYEVKVKMHIKAESADRATEHAILFMHPSEEHMKRHNIVCWIRDTFVQLCKKGKELKHNNFWDSECPYGEEADNDKEESRVHPEEGQDDKGDVPF